MLSSPRRGRRAFTLFQLLLVLALLLILIALFLPAIVGVRRTVAARSQCANNFKQIVLAMHNCNDTYGRMPPAVGSFPIQGKMENTCFFYLLPFIEQQNLYNNAAAGQDFSVWTNATYHEPVKTYLCQQDVSGGTTHRYDGWLATSNYAVNFLVFGDRNRNSLDGAPRLPATIPDGTSNTIFVAERLQMCGGEPNAWGYAGASPWAPVFAYYGTDHFQVNPSAETCDPQRAQGPHPGGFHVGLGDGSFRVLDAKLSTYTWTLACDPNDGLVMPADW
jgi:type II secretory pathway pseudopilin PulG